MFRRCPATLALCLFPSLILTAAATRAQHHAPTVEWSRALGTDKSDSGFGIAVSDQGQIFVYGETLGNLGAPSRGNDGFVAALERSGATAWIHQFGGGYNRSESIALDDAGNAYAVGGIIGDLDGPSAGRGDAFVRKLSSTGELVWGHQFGSDDIDIARGIAINSVSGASVLGQTRGNLIEPTGGVTRYFVRNFDLDGSLAWSRQFSSEQFAYAGGIAADSSGNLLVGGSTVEAVGSLPTGNHSTVLAKLDANGATLWTRTLATADHERFTDVAVDRLGNIFAAGYTDGLLGEASGGSNDAFLAKYDPDGNLQWLRQWGGSLSEENIFVASDNLGNAYLAGTSYERPPTGPPVQHVGFALKFDASGLLDWEYVHPFSTVGGFTDIATDSSSNVYVTGSQSANRNVDALVLKLRQIPEPSGAASAAIWIMASVGRARRNRR
jgi:hypothetical protein